MHKKLLVVFSLAALAGCATQTPQPGRPGVGQVIQQPQQQPQRPPGQYGELPNRTAPDYRQNPTGAADGSQSSQNSPAAPVPRTAAQASSPAVMSLLNSSDALAKAGHMDAAASTLERALDLEPRNPFIYQRIAAVRLAEGQAGQAEQMARKSNSLAPGNAFVQASNWRVIAEARKTEGDSTGASQARAQAVNFSQSTSAPGAQ